MKGVTPVAVRCDSAVDGVSDARTVPPPPVTHAFTSCMAKETPSRTTCPAHPLTWLRPVARAWRPAAPALPVPCPGPLPGRCALRGCTSPPSRKRTGPPCGCPSAANRGEERGGGGASNDSCPRQHQQCRTRGKTGQRPPLPYLALWVDPVLTGSTHVHSTRREPALGPGMAHTSCCLARW